VIQPSLFQAADEVLVDDERGRIVYVRSFLDPDLAARWFAELRQAVPWRTEERRMYDRTVVVPRLLGHFGLEPPDAETPPAIVEASKRVIAALDVPFNAVGLNFYRDGRDSVAPHNDHLYDIREGFPVALLSLGSTRRMDVRAKKPPRRTLHVDLAPGSLFVMSYETQLHYTHGIPKTDEPVGERISLAFRVKPPAREKQGTVRKSRY
jgi:alkylated DNA repair dioxygenase AlkB